MMHRPAPAHLAEMAAGYLNCAQWADAPEGSRARFTAQARADAANVCAVFCQYIGPELTAQALEHVTPAQLGHDLWLTRCGHGAGFWDRDALAVPPVRVPDLADRDGKPCTLTGRDAETLGGLLTAAANGPAGRIGPFYGPTLTAWRGWLTFDCDSAALALSGRVNVWPFWRAWVARASA